MHALHASSAVHQNSCGLVCVAGALPRHPPTCRCCTVDFTTLAIDHWAWCGKPLAINTNSFCMKSCKTQMGTPKHTLLRLRAGCGN
jgi:hypothetical protein